MNFNEMLEKARCGEKLRRKDWTSKESYAYMDSDKIIGGHIYNPYAIMTGLTYDDYLANDWELHPYFEDKKMVKHGMEIIQELVSRQEFPLAAKVRELVDYIKEKK